MKPLPPVLLPNTIGPGPHNHAYQETPWTKQLCKKNENEQNIRLDSPSDTGTIILVSNSIF